MEINSQESDSLLLVLPPCFHHVVTSTIVVVESHGEIIYSGIPIHQYEVTENIMIRRTIIITQYDYTAPSSSFLGGTSLLAGCEFMGFIIY